MVRGGPEYIESVSNYFPKTSFEIGTGTSSNLINRLKRNEFDIVFTTDPLNDPNVDFTDICKIDLSSFANPNKFDCSRTLDIVELANLPIILPLQGSSASAFAMLTAQPTRRLRMARFVAWRESTNVTQDSFYAC